MRGKRTAGAVALLCALTASAVAQPAPPSLDLLTSGSEIPFAVTMPQDVAAGPLALQQPFFDDFSWRSFIALNWPAALGPNGLPLRGVPDKQTPITKGLTATRTWESWKAAWELFKPTQDPTPFADYDRVPVDCPAVNAGNPPQRVLVMTSKVQSLVNDLNQAFSGPLIDQNQNYVRYEIKINQTQYNAIRDNRWFISDNLPKQVNFVSSVQAPQQIRGAIELKAAWRELIDGQDDFSRYYSTEVFLLEPGTPMTCRLAKMGLIGLHIVHKVAPFREWVWSSFEHVDNVPDPAHPARPAYSLNNGKDVPATVNGFFYPPTPDQPPNPLSAGQPLPPKSDPRRTPVQVTRFTPIRPDTQQINAAYQKLLRGTPFEFYQALPTQWPSIRGGTQYQLGGTYPTDSGNPFPLRHVSNTTAETYFQNSRRSSCMECHYQAAGTDFSWVLALRASASTAASRARLESVLDRLRGSTACCDTR